MNSMPVCNWCSYDKWQNFCLVFPLSLFLPFSCASSLRNIFYMIAISISRCACLSRHVSSQGALNNISLLSALSPHSFRVSGYECAQLDTAMPCPCCTLFFSGSLSQHKVLQTMNGICMQFLKFSSTHTKITCCCRNEKIFPSRLAVAFL